MHEWGIVAAAVRAAAEPLRAPADAAELRIAPSVDPDVARLAFAAAAAGTLLEPADLRVRVIEHELACLDCACRYPGVAVTACPACGGDGLIVASPRPAEVIVSAGSGPSISCLTSPGSLASTLPSRWPLAGPSHG